MINNNLNTQPPRPRRYVDELTDEQWADPAIRNSALIRINLTGFDPDLIKKGLDEDEQAALRQADSRWQIAQHEDSTHEEAVELEREGDDEMGRLFGLAHRRRERERASARHVERPPAQVIPISRVRTATRSRAPRRSRQATTAAGGARDGPSGDDDAPGPPGGQRATGRRTEAHTTRRGGTRRQRTEPPLRVDLVGSWGDELLPGEAEMLLPFRDVLLRGVIK